MYLVKDIYGIVEKWNFANIYELGNNNKVYTKDTITIKKIEDILKSERIEEAGNLIRQKFEVLLYELSKILAIGAVEDSKQILHRIENSKNLYFRSGKTTPDLVDELIGILKNEDSETITLKRIDLKIKDYQKNSFDILMQILKRLKLYRKVTMHPMSHGVTGQHSFTRKEIEESLAPLKKLEKSLKNLIDTDVAGI
jgi:hypothetical protein